MKNRDGFTLIEIIAVIVILGLIIVIAVPFFQGSLNEFRDDYYDGLATNINNSAKAFFKDNRLYLPNRYLDTQKVDLDTLNDQRYIKDIKDYNGKNCDSRNGYVLAIKTAMNEYEYAACFECTEDDYSYTSSIYCSEAWDSNKGFTEVIFDAPPDVLVYVGTSREKLKEKVVVYPDVRRCLGVGSCTKEITRVSARGDMGVQPIYPKDLDNVDTSKVGTYEVTYVYDLNDKDSSGRQKEKKGRVIVYDYHMKDYDHTKPETDNDIYFTKMNTVYKIDDSNTVIKKTTELKTSRYNPNDANDWAQKLNIKFNYNQIVDGKKVLVSRYQWFINGRWEDYCVPNRTVNKENNSCDKTIGNVAGGFELNDEIRFRFIDINGMVSSESKYKLRIDYTVPDTCSLTLSGTKGTLNNEAKEWFVGDKVTVSFASKDDATKTSGHSGGAVKSGINYYGVTTGKRVSNESANQTADTTSVTWYGYVEDKAGNFTVCAKTFKKDSTAPECTKRGDNTTWTNSKVTVYWGCKDITSGCATAEASKEFSASGTYQKTWTAAAYDIYDKAGNKTTCEAKSRNIYFDKKAPGCSNRGDSTTYTKDNRTIYYGCLDSSESGQSGCNTSEKSVEFKSTTVTSDIAAYTIKDVAGNSTTCPKRTANVYVDKTAPSCGTATGATTSWATSRTIKQACSDSNSGCAKASYDTTYNSTTKTASVDIYDNVGNKKTCTYNVYVDTTAPSCGTATGASSSWQKTSRTVKQACTDSDSGCAQTSYDATYSSTTKTASVDIYDKVGNKNTCTYNVYVDTTAPTCSISKTSTGGTGGVGVGISCSDSNSGCKSDNPTSGSSLKSNTTYTVYDTAGNSGTCSVSITSYSCNGYNCNCSNCHTGSNTCQGGNESTRVASSKCPAGWTRESGGRDEDGFWSNCTRWNSCKTGSNTCAYGCDTCYETCYK